MQEYKRTIYNNDDNYSWELLEQEANELHMTLARFTLFCYKLYFKEKGLNRFKLNVTQTTLGLILFIQIIIVVLVL